MTSMPFETLRPASPAEVSQILEENARGPKRPIYPVGGGTTLEYGYPLTDPGTMLSLGQLANTIEYPARDMTITVEAGIPIDRLAAILQTERQRLPIDVPQSAQATLGGIVATDVRGPRSFGLGSLRDYVIGVSAADASGRPFKAGGRVVKNVAGYDLCKLMIGSLGTLGVITQLTLKVRPMPDSTASIWATFSKLAEIDAVLTRLVTSAARPVAIGVFDPRAAERISAAVLADVPATLPVLFVVVEGGAHETAWELETIAAEIAPFSPRQSVRLEADWTEQLLRAQTEFSVEAGTPLVFQAHLLPSKVMEFFEQASAREVAVAAQAGTGTIIGHLPTSVNDADAAAGILNPLRTLARAGHGNLIVSQCDPKWKRTLPIFGDPEPSWTLMRKLKFELDPDDILNRGRMWLSEQSPAVR